MSRNKPLPPTRRIIHVELDVDLIEWVDRLAFEATPKLDRSKVLTALLSDARARDAYVSGCNITIADRNAA